MPKALLHVKSHTSTQRKRPNSRGLPGTVDADDAGHVVVALLGQGQHPHLVQVLQRVRQQVGGNGGTKQDGKKDIMLEGSICMFLSLINI